MAAPAHRSIDVVATFLGLRWLPKPLVLATNNARPKLILHDNVVEYRVLRTGRFGYAAIDSVDVWLWRGTHGLWLSRTDSGFTLVANCASRPALVEGLRFLHGKNCPLTPRAERLIGAART